MEPVRRPVPDGGLSESTLPPPAAWHARARQRRICRATDVTALSWHCSDASRPPRRRRSAHARHSRERSRSLRARTMRRARSQSAGGRIAWVGNRGFVRWRRRLRRAWQRTSLAAVAVVMPGVGPIVADGPLAAALGEAAGHMAGGIARALERAGLDERRGRRVGKSGSKAGHFSSARMSTPDAVEAASRDVLIRTRRESPRRGRNDGDDT